MDLLQSLLLGVIEGITEFLPISSTGHLILATEFLGIPHTEFQKSFEIIIQLGAIFAVVALYWKAFLDLEVLKRLFAAFIPTAVIGFVLYSFIKSALIGNTTVVLWMLFLGGIALIIFELFHREREDATEHTADMSYTQAVLIGFFQAIAVVPGVSRSAASILGGLLAGLKRTTIVEFSFLLAVPTMIAATGYDIIKSASVFSTDQFGLLAAGFISSFIVAMLAIKFLLAFVKSHTFIGFGIYRIALAALFFLFIL
jgi:undecaprenyl-diphosphatase